MKSPAMIRTEGYTGMQKHFLWTLLNVGLRVLKNTKSNEVNQNPGAQGAPGYESNSLTVTQRAPADLKKKQQWKQQQQLLIDRRRTIFDISDPYWPPAHTLSAYNAPSPLQKQSTL